MDHKLIDDYETGGDLIRSAIAGLSPGDLLWIPPKDAGVGAWSIQDVVIHLMDGDLIWASRMKRIIAEEHPVILGFDENKFVANLFYDKQDVQRAIQILDLNRRQFTKALRKLPESAFGRIGRHNERGDMTLEQGLAAITNHIPHHLKFVSAKREKLGKPLK